VLEALAARGQKAGGQVGLGEPRFRPGLEGHPPRLAGDGERTLESGAGLVDLFAQEVGATDEGERERCLLVAAGPFCQLDGTSQVDEGSLVGARVGGGQAEHRLDTGSLVVRFGQRRCSLQALGAAGVARSQDVDIAELAICGGGDIAQAVLFGERAGTKQGVRALLVATAGGVDQGGAEGEPAFGLQRSVSARLGLRRRACE
jgi:hypothetical protein